MGLQQQWEQLVEAASSDERAQQQFWGAYYAAETDAYKNILSQKRQKLSGTAKEVAASLGLETALFAGFCDGINTSLTAPVDLDALEEDAAVELDIDWEKLYYNMHEARAQWLYTLPEWDGVLDEGKRKQITADWRAAHVVKVEKKPGRNAPCPCGSGKKYKYCCGARG
nr:SEC-C metal-binding domain-containing protein [bacterium]